MVGKSYPGITQLFVAGAQAIPGDEPRTQEWIDGVLADHLAAIVPGHVFADLYRDVPYPGGIQNVTFAGGWSAQRAYEGYVAGPEAYAGRQRRRAVPGQPGAARAEPAVQPVRAGAPAAEQLRQRLLPRALAVLVRRRDRHADVPHRGLAGRAGRLARHAHPRARCARAWTGSSSPPTATTASTTATHVFPHITRFLDYHLREAVPAGEQRHRHRDPHVEPVCPNGKPHPTKNAPDGPAPRRTTRRSPATTPRTT